MHRATMSLLGSLILVAAIPTLAGESPYNPGAASTASVLAKTPMSYYCTAQGNGESKWYVTGFESAPNMGTPEFGKFEGSASQAFTLYMNATYGARTMMYAHCTVGASQGLRPSWEQMQADPRFKETVHVNWRFGQDAPAASSTSPN